MKKNILISLIMSFLILILLGIWLQWKNSQVHIWVYLPDSLGQWTKNKTDIPVKTELQNLEEAVSFLWQGIPEKNLLPVFPASIHYKKMTLLEKGAVEIDFYSDYQNLDGLQRAIGETALVKTLTGFPRIDRIYFYQDGIPFSAINRNRSTDLRTDDCYTDIAESIQVETLESQLLYFYDSRKQKLVGVERETVRPNYISKADWLLQELQREPDIEGLTTLLPAHIKLNQIKIRNQVCYLDWNQDFLKTYIDLGSKKRMLVYSIVNTLTTLEDIKFVQFLINGENPETFAEADGLKDLLRKNHVYVEYE